VVSVREGYPNAFTLKSKNDLIKDENSNNIHIQI
jgi:hypothetical protein